MDPAVNGSATPEPELLDAPRVARDPQLEARFTESAHRILADLVAAGAALGWVEPPSRDEVAALLGDIVCAARAGDAALRAACLGGRLVGLGYWLRYARPTHRPHADLEKLAVDPAAHGRGVGRAPPRNPALPASTGPGEQHVVQVRVGSGRLGGELTAKH